MLIIQWRVAKAYHCCGQTGFIAWSASIANALSCECEIHENLGTRPVADLGLAGPCNYSHNVKEVQSNHSPANDSGRLRLSISKYQYFCYRFAKPMSQGVLDLWNSTWDTVFTLDMMNA